MFDPYHKWLGIAPKDQPPNHYRLLGIDLFESDSDVIDAAANRQMAYLQQRATGKHAAVSQKLLNEIAAARVCLLNRTKKAAYDAELKAKLAEADQGNSKPDLSELESSPVAAAQPVASVQVRPARYKRSFRLEPWHYAVAIGVASLLAIGAWAVFGTGDQSDQAIVSAGTEPQQDQAPPPADPPLQAEDKGIAESVTVEPKPSESSNDPSGEKTSIEPAVAEPKPSESPSGTSEKNPDAWTPCIYRLTIEPSWADVDVKSTKAVVTGSGRQRTISFDERPESLNVRVMVTCAGYEWKQEWLTPESGKVQYITVSLTKSPEATSGEEGMSGSGKAMARQSVSEARCLWGHKGEVTHVSVSPDGRYIASGSTDKTVILWNRMTGDKIWRFTDLSSGVFALAFTSSGEDVWVCDRNHVKRLNLADGVVSKLVSITPIEAAGGTASAALDRRCTKLLTAAKGELRIYDLAAGKKLSQMNNMWVPAPTFDPTGQYGICGGNEGQGVVFLGDWRNQNKLRQFYGLRDRTIALTTSPDGKYLAAASGPARPKDGPTQNKVIVWGFSSGKIIREWTVSAGWQWALAFSPDGRLLVTGGSGTAGDWFGGQKSSDKSIRVWDVATGREERRLEGHGVAVRSLAITPDGRDIVSGSGDWSVRIWPLSD